MFSVFFCTEGVVYMGLYFKSLASSSSGNSLALWTENSCVVVDFGLGSMKKCRQAIAEHLPDSVSIDAAVISHIHGDHISFYPLRVLEQLDCSVMVHRDSIEPLKAKHFREYGFGGLDICPFDEAGFSVGDFTFEPFEVAHNPVYPTFGFVIKCDQPDGVKKIVVATDFCNWQDVADKFVDADFIFVESNHDYELLRRYFNPNSRFHLPNPETAKLLCHVRQKSKRPPQAVMLGHISSQRNTPEIAIRETSQAFGRAGVAVDFDLMAAPLKGSGDTIKIIGTEVSA